MIFSRVQLMTSRLASSAAGSALKAGAKYMSSRSSTAILHSSSMHSQYASFSSIHNFTRLDEAQSGAVFRRELSTSASASMAQNNQEEEEQIVADLIRKIKADLVEADVNNDGRIDSDELKMVLRKSPDIFSDSDVVDIGNLFYEGRGGESISHEKFLEAISCAVGKSEVDEEGGQHRRVGSISHPLVRFLFCFRLLCGLWDILAACCVA